MNDFVISAMNRFIDEYLFEPRISWSEHFFIQRSYSRWAAYEIQERIVKEAMRLPSHITGRENISAYDIVKEFKNEIDYFLEISDKETSKLIFSSASDVAEQILYLFSSLEEGEHFL